MGAGRPGRVRPLRAGGRLLLQFEFTNNLFGQSYETVPLGGEVDRRLDAALRERPGVYRRFLR